MCAALTAGRRKKRAGKGSKDIDALLAALEEEPHNPSQPPSANPDTAASIEVAIEADTAQVNGEDKINSLRSESGAPKLVSVDGKKGKKKKGKQVRAATTTASGGLSACAKSATPIITCWADTTSPGPDTAFMASKYSSCAMWCRTSHQ